jgi:hypothetical protein
MHRERVEIPLTVRHQTEQSTIHIIAYLEFAVLEPDSGYSSLEDLVSINIPLSELIKLYNFIQSMVLELRAKGKRRQASKVQTEYPRLLGQLLSTLHWLAQYKAAPYLLDLLNLETLGKEQLIMLKHELENWLHRSTNYFYEGEDPESEIQNKEFVSKVKALLTSLDVTIRRTEAPK